MTDSGMESVVSGGAAVRRCQVLFEPYFQVPHSVWLEETADGSTVVVVSIWAEDSPVERHTAVLDRRTADMLDELCSQFFDYRPACERAGLDGTYHHVAHPDPGGGYRMRTFWSPAHDSVDHRFVSVVEALRDYAVSPVSLRPTHWSAIHRRAGRIDRSIEPELFKRR